jgi:hypothetical protein
MKDQMTGTVSDLVTECRQCGRPLMRCECCEECAAKDAEIARLQETLQKIADGIGVDVPTLIKRVDRAARRVSDAY